MDLESGDTYYRGQIETGIEVLGPKKVTIIGAGPVGLWTAIQIKQQDKEGNIGVKIFEKYKEYQRKHGLHIDTANLQSEYNTPQLTNWIKSLQKNSNASKVVFVSTKELEDKLLELAKSLDIEVVYEAVNTKEKMDEVADDCDILIGADGSHSFVRETVFSDLELVKKDLKFIIELKFQLKCKSEEKNLMFDKVRELYPTEKVLNFLAEEHISDRNSETTNKKQSTLRFFVDEKTYTALGEVSFKNPKNLKKDWEQLPQKLKDDILKWFAIKQMCDKQLEIDPQDCAITKLTISAYRSAKVFKIENNRKYLLVGDSAGGVPYFKALNIALKTSKTMVNHIIKLFQGDKESLSKYEEYYIKLISKEIFKAKVKTTTLNQVNTFVKISNKVPWQVNKWDWGDRQKIESRSRHIQEYILGKAEHQDYSKACNCGHHEPPVSRFAAAVNLVKPRS